MEQNLGEHEYYKKAGKIAAKVLKEALKLIKPEVKLVEVADYVEKRIVELGGRPAFPCNISINERAAHYTPKIDDESVFKEGDYVKLDIGVHVDGYIADVAKTIIVGSSADDLVRASEDALKEAIKSIKPGMRTGEVGAVIEETIKSYGYKPIINLTGHKLERYRLHTGSVIPNVGTSSGDVIKVGDVYAIEPFATNGFGKVVDESEAVIFRYLRDKPLRLKDARIILQHVKNNYKTLPFAERWLSSLMPKLRLYNALRHMVYYQVLHAYFILREKDRGVVSQAEHTVIITEKGAEIITEL